MTRKVSEQLKSPIFNSSERRAALSRAVRRSALELVTRIKLPIANGQPAGVTYRRGRVSKPVNAMTAALNLRTFVTKGNQERAIVGYKFHRASAPGQVPAVDTSGLLGSIADKPLGELKSLAFVGKLYGDPLDKGTPTVKARPFFAVRVDEYRPVFKQNVVDELGL